MFLEMKKKTNHFNQFQDNMMPHSRIVNTKQQTSAYNTILKPNSKWNSLDLTAFYIPLFVMSSRFKY